MRACAALAALITLLPAPAAATARATEVRLLAAVAAPVVVDRTPHRLRLARHYVQAARPAEALAVLDRALADRAELRSSAQFLSLRGRALVQQGRHGEALADLAQPVLVADAALAAWRAYALERCNQPRAALAALKASAPALAGMSADAQATFLLAGVRAAVQLGYPATASRLLAAVRPDASKLAGEAHYWRGVTAARLGRPGEAKGWYRRAAQGGNPAARQLAAMALAAPEAAATGRFAWRGGEVERVFLEREAAVALSKGDRRGWLAATDAVNRYLMPDRHTAARTAQAQALFLATVGEGSAALPPAQALAFYWDFRHLAPRGAAGDRIVAGLIDRLEANRLHSQATRLLAWQLAQRLQGDAGPAAALRLVGLYRAAGEPERALAAAAGARRLRLAPAQLAALARHEAASLVALGRYDEAHMLVAGDDGAEARALRADIAWGRRDWNAVTALLADRLPEPEAAAAPAAAAALVRYGVACAMLRDEARLAALSLRYAGRIADPDLAATLAALTDGPEALTPQALSQALAATARLAAAT